eukprot:maker-scaffold95_size379157-snap-gene-2.29 protein:Tk00605 transcript:maker-scaffold95_size379157-snap-gene-2.29-mRNA-1 annotation:"---NA---"
MPHQGQGDHFHPEPVNFHCYHNARPEEQQHLLLQQQQRPSHRVVEYQPQYVELAFHGPQNGTTSGSIVGVSQGRRVPPTSLPSPHGGNPNSTLYATIDHRKTTTRRTGDDSASDTSTVHLIHSPNCPLKAGTLPHSSSSTMPRSHQLGRGEITPSPVASSLRQTTTPGSGTLKRVAFRDDVLISSPSSSSGTSTQVSSSVIPNSSGSSSSSRASSALPRESSFSGPIGRVPPQVGRFQPPMGVPMGHHSGSSGYSSSQNYDDTSIGCYPEPIPRSSSTHSTNSSVTGGIPAFLPAPPPGYESDQSKPRAQADNGAKSLIKRSSSKNDNQISLKRSPSGHQIKSPTADSSPRIVHDVESTL